MIKINDVYDELSYTIWKSVLEINYDIAKKKQIPYEDAPPVVIIYNYLNILKELKYVEDRKRELSNEELKNRGNREKLEYKLTEDGVKARDKFLEDILFMPGLLPDHNKLYKLSK